MKKAVPIIAGLTFLVVAIFVGWALFAGLSHIWEKMPQWIAGGEKVVKEALKRAEDVAPAIKEKAKEIIPDRIPEKDVGGEDIKGVPRYPDMIRVSYEIIEQKRTIVYKGKVDFMAVVDFYKKEMTARNFKKRVVSASSIEETHIYKKDKNELEFCFKRADLLGSEITELTIKEL